MVTSSSTLRVRFSETDAMGVVYHANYLNWFEVARVDLMDSLGLAYTSLVKQGIHLPVIEANAKYRQPAKFDDMVTVSASIKDRPAVKIKVEYEVKRGEDLLCTGYTIHVFVDKSGLPIKPPKEFLAKLRSFVEDL